MTDLTVANRCQPLPAGTFTEPAATVQAMKAANPYRTGVATVANRCLQRLATRSAKRCHRCLSLKGGNVATVTQPGANQGVT